MIRRYYATKDNTITNAFEENLTTRGTGSNMGASDILETFSIYNQISNSSGISSELARMLIEFDIPDITSDRASGLVPASGSVSWYLKMYDAPHSQTVPSDFTLQVSAVSGSWQEGYGIDMDFYEDLTKDGIGSNWINANGSLTSATATVTVVDGDAANGMTEKEHITIISTDGTTKRYVITNAASDGSTATGTILSEDAETDTGASTAGANEDGGVAVSIDLSSATQNAFLVQLKAAIEHANGHNGKITVSAVPGQANGNQAITLTQAATGRAGNSVITTDISQIVEGTSYVFTNGNGQWVNTGGDYYADPLFTQSFPSGLEDLCLDVTPLVEQWIDSAGNVLGSKDNHGFGIKLTNSIESEARSFFTKKFFGRDSEFYFQRPVLEARWDSARRDDRGSFYLSSSLAPADDNLNTIYLYNRIRGRLRDIPAIGSSNAIRVSLFSGSSDNSGPAGSALALSLDIAGNVSSDNRYVVTGSHVATGIYSATFAITGSTTLTTLYDVWFSGSTAFDHALGLAPNQFTTGSISVKSFNSIGYNPDTTHVLSMPGLRKEYRTNQTHRLNLYVREKNWSPNIHTKAVQSSIPSLIIPSASFQLRRSIDDYIVVPYGTGSSTEAAYTSLSYDVSGNYFDLDTTYLETGYLYEIQYSFYDEENGWEEQPYRFKFRVVD